MFTLVIGGSASGKSEYAEKHTLSLDGKRIYLATMQPWDEECRARIAKHRSARLGRGFETVEKYTSLTELKLPADGNVLLEDLGNLAANELYSPEGGGAEAVLQDVNVLLASVRHLTVVTNEVFSGGSAYEEETLRYLRVLAEVNRRLAAKADLAVEIVCGCENFLKGGRV